MKKPEYITEEERKRCEKVAAAFADFCEEEDISVLAAGRFGYVKLQNYTVQEGLDSVMTFTDAELLMEALWKDWITVRLFEISHGTAWEDDDPETLLGKLPEEKKTWFAQMRIFFEKKAEFCKK